MPLSCEKQIQAFPVPDIYEHPGNYFSYLLLEDGTFLLLEDGTELLLENSE